MVVQPRPLEPRAELMFVPELEVYCKLHYCRLCIRAERTVSGGLRGRRRRCGRVRWRRRVWAIAWAACRLAAAALQLTRSGTGPATSGAGVRTDVAALHGWSSYI